MPDLPDGPHAAAPSAAAPLAGAPRAGAPRAGTGTERRPRLLIDARPECLGGLDPARRLLGLTPLRRLALAARKAGFGEIQVLSSAADRAALAEALGPLPQSGFAAEPPRRGTGVATLLVPADRLGEPGWLGPLARTGIGPGELRHADGLWLLGADVAPARVLEAAAEPEALPLALEAAPLRLRGPADLPAAERRLLRGLRKKTDGFMSRVFARPISIALSRRLAPLGVTPNAMTLVSLLIGLAAAPFFLSAEPAWQVAGALLFVAHSVLDGCDGELARLTFHETRLGGLLDFAGDNLVHVAVFACMALGWADALDAAWPLLFGLGAVLGTAGSAFAVYWMTLRRPRAGEAGPLYTSVSGQARPSRVTRLLDELSRRDFIYLVLAFAVFGKAQWFVAMSGLGAPAFLVTLLAAALAERRRG